MDRYLNNRQVFRKNGRYTTPPSLVEQGYDINTSYTTYTCPVCSESRTPISNAWNCSCGSKNHKNQTA